MEPLLNQPHALLSSVPTIMISFLYFVAGILMQMNLNASIDSGMKMMKYSLNHYWKFKHFELAWLAGFL